MVLDKQTTAAYHCPACGMAVMSLVNIFSMSGNILKLKCACGDSALEMHITKDGKVRVQAPCIVCPSPHSYVISSKSLFEKDVFELSCALIGVGICFFGKKNSVLAALKESEAELMDIFAEHGDVEEDDGAKRETEDDPRDGVGPLLRDGGVMERVLRILTDLLGRGAVECGCKKKEITVDIKYDAVEVGCRACGARRTLRARSFDDAEYLEGMEVLALDHEAPVK